MIVVPIASFIHYAQWLRMSRCVYIVLYFPNSCPIFCPVFLKKPARSTTVTTCIYNRHDGYKTFITEISLVSLPYRTPFERHRQDASLSPLNP